jgi:hypothetical protein
MVSNLIMFAYMNGMELTFGHAWRSKYTQEHLVEKGLSKTMNSKHLEKLAVDFNLFIDDEYITEVASYIPLGEYWKLMGGTWGGDFINFPDAGHFEYKD